VPTSYLTTSASHSVPTQFNPKSDAYATQSVDLESLSRTRGSDCSIRPLLLANPKPHARNA